MSKKKLEPCPFCGGKAAIYNSEFPAKLSQYKRDIPKGSRIIRSVKYPQGKIWWEYRQPAFVPKCLDTKCLGRIHRLFETEDDAIEAWNRRTPA